MARLKLIPATVRKRRLNLIKTCTIGIPALREPAVPCGFKRLSCRKSNKEAAIPRGIIR